MLLGPASNVPQRVQGAWVEEGEVRKIVALWRKQAQAAAAGKVIIVMGANVAQQMLKEKLADEVYIQLVPVLLGSGSRLFENFGEPPLELICDRAVNSPQITHLKYKVRK